MAEPLGYRAPPDFLMTTPFRRRSVRVLLILLLVVAIAAAVMVWLRRARAPESVRLLPDGDAVIYFNVSALRTLGAFSGTKVMRDPEYEDFVRATGIEFERDLDEAAFAVHAGKPSPQPGGSLQSQALPADTRFSEIFIGKFDIERTLAYFRKLSNGSERYRDIDIYNIPHDNRVVKVAILGLNRIAVSNTESREPIHRMIDRYRSAAMHAAGPSLVSSYRDHVPFGSVVWAIARIGDGSGPGIPAPGMLAELSGTTVVASARPALGAQLRVEDIAADGDSAQRIVDNGNSMLKIFRDLQASSSPSGTDADVKQVFDSLKLERENASAVLSTTIPPGFLKKITSEPPQIGPEPTPTPTPMPAPKGKARKQAVPKQ
jgi:hypothetical protein